MQITFGEDAFDAYKQFAERIPAEYTVALLPDEHAGIDSPPDEYDVRFLSADDDGVTYEVLDEHYEGTGEIKVKPWAEIARIHVY